MTSVASGHRVSALQRNHSDQKIIERDDYTSTRRFGSDLTSQFRRLCMDWIDRYSCFQIIKELAPGSVTLRSCGPVDPVGQFGHANR